MILPSQISRTNVIMNLNMSVSAKIVLIKYSLDIYRIVQTHQYFMNPYVCQRNMNPDKKYGNFT